MGRKKKCDIKEEELQESAKKKKKEKRLEPCNRTSVWVDFFFFWLVISQGQKQIGKISRV